MKTEIKGTIDTIALHRDNKEWVGWMAIKIRGVKQMKICFMADGLNHDAMYESGIKLRSTVKVVGDEAERGSLENCTIELIKQ